ncbi:type IV pilus twitching motility protein PilT [Granulicella mallensis]|uniref:Twitching motility protein PilT n=1 Tax=Granulicella mallensis TaxID=940614 RepID=A0A7W8E9L2_9BACT|nr:PilT/PilU family type 4a pilus ATPase [Granulicella mallensis]MBB5063811.1 twitching motility protein PilT [Granulicella mallensis]
MSVYESDLSQLVYELNRTVPGAKTATTTASLDSLLALAAGQGASDVLLVAGSAITLRINGSLAPATGKVQTPEDLRGLLLPLLTNEQSKELEAQRALDFCFVRGATGRFRANVHYQRGTLAASIRLLPAQIPTVESLHLPPVLARLTERRQGLILLTGPTGSGKTSTMAALIDQVNARRRDHIITIEDPVEYQHTNRNSIVEQIEVGHDTPSFADAVRAVLRQNPDVILIGEMRDSETMAAALTAAETGHLVLSSLHTNDAAQTMSRILDSFPASNQAQIRQQLSLALLAVIAQQLVPGIGPVGRYPAVEVMVATTAIRNMIRTGQDHQIRSHISTSRGEGMMTMDQSLAELARTRRITQETALAHCYHPEELRSHLLHPA